MAISKGTWSASVCRTCRRQLTLSEGRAKMTLCTDCTCLESAGVYTIKQYNNWLKKK